MNTDPNTASRRERTMPRKKPLEAYILASSSSFAPRRLEERLPAPIPIVKPIAWITAMIENTMPTAPAAEVPSCATKKVSAMLYMLETSMETIVGTASFKTSRRTGVSVIFL